MKHIARAIPIRCSLIILLFGIGLSARLLAQSPTVDPTKVDPGTLQALEKMGAYLRTLQTFQVRAIATSEIVLTDGQKITLDQTTNLLAHLPDKLMVQSDGDKGSKIYFFGGQTFTIFDRTSLYYGVVPAPAKVRELVDILQDKYDIEIPLVDLFLWGAPNHSSPKITSAIDVGPSEVDRVTCEHYAFRQEGLDWQVWIQQGDFPLPRKLVLTTLTDEARPQHTSLLSWSLAPSYNEAAFIFSPPKGAQKITTLATDTSGGDN